VLLTSICFAVAAITPHLLWFIETEGSDMHFSFSNDEEYYFDKVPASKIGYRAFSSALLRFCSSILGVEGTQLFFDFGTVLTLIMIGVVIFRTLQWSKISSLILAIIFTIAPTILSFNTSPPWPHNWVGKMVEGFDLEKWYVVPISSSAFILRTPEPQFSVILSSIWLLVLLYIAKNNRLLRKTDYFFLTPIALLIVIDPFCNAQCLLLAFLVAGGLMIQKCWKQEIKLTVFCGFSIVVAGASLLFRFGMQSQTATSTSVVESHIPLVSNSILLSILAIGCWYVWNNEKQKGGSWFLDRQSMIGMALLLVPIIVLNQQVITGKLVMGAKWEDAMNYRFVLVGATILFCRGNRAYSLLNKFRLPFIAICILGVFLFQYKLYNKKLYFNKACRAFSTAITGINLRPGDEFYLKPNSYAAFLRINGVEDTSLGYNHQKTFGVSKPEISWRNFTKYKEMPIVEYGFKYFNKFGYGVDAFEKEVLQRIDSGSSQFLSCWFQTIEVAKRFSNFREYDKESLRLRVPQIVEAYSQYLEKVNKLPPKDNGRTFLLALDRKDPKLGTLIGQYEVGRAGRKVYVFQKESK